MKLDDGLRTPRASVRVLKRALIDGRETEGVEIKPGQTVAAAVEARTPNLSDHERSSLRVVLHGADDSHVLPPANWRKIRLKPGAFLVITDPPAGGSLRTILSIVVSIAALAVAGPLAGALFGTLSAAGLATATGLIGAGLAFAGNLLINLVVPVRNGLDADKQSPTYSIEGIKNPLDVGGCVPLPVGLRHRFAPKFIVPPYIDVQNDDVYLTAGFCCGYAPMAYWNTKIGDRLLSRFDDRFFDIERRGFLEGGIVDTSPFTLFDGTVIQKGQQIRIVRREEAADEDDDDGPLALPTIIQTEPNTVRWKAIFNLPSGLNRTAGKKKKTKSYDVELKFEIRPVTETNDAPWTFVEEFRIDRKELQPFFVEVEHEVPGGLEARGAYEIAITRLSADGDSDHRADVDLIAFQSILPEYPINQPADAPFAMVAVRIKATNQLKGTLDEFNEEYASLIEALNPATGLYEPMKETGNPADWYRRLLTAQHNVKAIPEDQLFEAEIQDWHAHNVANELMFSRIYDTDISADAAIRDVCAVGRAVPRLAGTLRGVSIDRAKDPLTAYPLTPHNTWKTEGKRSYKENEIHGWRIKFRDRTNEFKNAIREVVRPDLPAGVEAVNFEEREPPGITDPRQAYIYGYKLWLEVIHRADVWNTNLDWESRFLQHGDLTALSHRFISIDQQSGKVRFVLGNIVDLSEPIMMEAGKSYAVKFRRIVELDDGSAESRVLLWPVRTVPGTSTRLTLVGTGDLPLADDLAWFGEATMMDVGGVIQDVEANDDFNGRVTIVEQAPQIFDILAALEVPPYSSLIGAILPPDTRAPPAPVVQVVSSSDSQYSDDETISDSPRRVGVYLRAGIGLPRATQDKVRTRKGAGAWAETSWFSSSSAYARITAYNKGDAIEVQAKGRTRLGIESQWSASAFHTVGQSDPIGPVVATLTAEALADGIDRYMLTSADEWALAQVRIIPGAYVPGSPPAFQTMTPIHSGSITAFPYLTDNPTGAGSFTVAAQLTNDDGDTGVPFYIGYVVDAEAVPGSPADPKAVLASGLVTASARAPNSPTLKDMLCRRGGATDTFAAMTVDIFTPPPFLAVPNQVLSATEASPGAGAHRYGFVARNNSAAASAPAYAKLGISSEADAAIARMTVAPDTTRANELRFLIARLVSVGAWARLDAIYLLAQHDAQAARLNLKQNAFNLTANGTLTFTVDRGYKGDGTTGYLESGYDPTTAGGVFTQNSASMFVWPVENTQNAISDIGNTSSFLLPRSATDTYSARINTSTSDTGASTDSSGLLLVSRADAAGFLIDKNGAQLLAPVRASIAPSAVTKTLCARRTTSSALQFASRRLGAGGWGGSLTAPQRAEMYAALRDYLAAVGAA